MPEKLRVGILGAGDAGRAHANAYLRMEQVEVGAIWSRTRARAEGLAGDLPGKRARVYDHWEELVDEAAIDVLSVATPAVLRRGPVERGLRRGLHVLVEKPFTVDLAEARELAQMAAGARTVTAVSLNWRYAPGSIAARQAIREGQIGQLFDINQVWQLPFTIERLGETFIGAKPFVSVHEQGGGLLREGGSHEFDRMGFITGLEMDRVASVLVYPEPAGNVGLVRAEDFNIELQTLVMARFTPAGAGTFRFVVAPGVRTRQTTFYGEGGTLAMEDTGALVYGDGESEPRAIEVAEVDRAEEGVPLLQHTWNRLIADFVAAVRAGDIRHEGVPRLPVFEDGVRTLEIINGAERAAARGEWVEVGAVD